MPGKSSDGTNRRELLRKTAITCAAMVAGATTLSGSAAAFHFEVGDRVRVNSYSANTYDSCCTEWDCQRTQRDVGDEGEVIGECELNSTYHMYQINWDTKESDEYWMSWIVEDDIEHA